MDSKDNKEDLTPHEADKRMENMAKLSKEPEHAFDIERLREQYKDELEKNKDDHIKSRIYYSMGERAGLHQKSINEVDQIYEEKNVKVTQKRYVVAKEIYREHGNTASKNFSSSKLKGMLKHEFEEEKQTPDKNDQSLSEKFNLKKDKDKDIDMDR